MEIFSDIKVAQLISTIVYSVLGFGLFGLALWVMERITNFSIEKEIVEQHNTSMAIVIGSLMIAMAIIIAAVVD